MGQLRQAFAYGVRALWIAKFGDHPGECRALGNLGHYYLRVEDFEQAITQYEQSLSLARALSDRYLEGLALNGLGSAYRRQGDLQRAFSYYEESLRCAEELRDPAGFAMIAWNTGLGLAELGYLERAIEPMEIGLDYEQSVDHDALSRHRAILAELRQRLETNVRSNLDVVPEGDPGRE